MKSWPYRAIKICVFTFAVFCLSLHAQVAGSAPADGTKPIAAAAAAPVKPDTPARTAKSDDSFIIGDDDVLAISVWKEPDLTKAIPVRSDGKISLPLVGEVQAAGRTPLQLEQEITERLSNYITNPQVNVIVQEVHSEKFNILGQVIKPGSYPLTAGTTIVDAIATAGGFKDFARKKSIYLLRLDPKGGEFRYSFNYDEFIKGKNTLRNIMLKPRDTVVVP